MPRDMRIHYQVCSSQQAILSSTTGQISFRSLYDKLLVWGWTSEQMTEYNYLFHPLSVGCEIMVEHPESGTKNHLTKDVGW